MPKSKKNNKESKKPKAISDELKKQKKDPKKYDGTVLGLFGRSK